MGTLLIAGPLALDDLPGHPGTLGGVGGYAAIAAAPLATTQLWCRGGSDLTPALRGILERRGIDLSGVEWHGPTPRGGAAGFVAGGPLLAEGEPTDAEDLGAVLLIGLPPDELRRALHVVRSLPGAEHRPLVLSPRPADLADGALRAELGAACDLLVLSVARARELTGAGDALAAARAFQGDGFKAVALTAGVLGGLLAYGQKATTWPTTPVAAVDKAGVSAAFPGALAGWLAGPAACDWTTLKRACWVASCAAGACAEGVGPRALLKTGREDLLERWTRLRREHKS